MGYYKVVPYIGTWIETFLEVSAFILLVVVPYIGTWIETPKKWSIKLSDIGRTLYRYVD